MKTQKEIRDAMERRLSTSWADTVVAELIGEVTAWPHQFNVGRATSAELADAFGNVPRLVADWRTWASTNGVELIEERRRVSGTEQSLPSHIRVATADAAAVVVGGEWPGRLERGRRHAARLAERFPDLVRPTRTVAATDGYSEVDFELLLDAADWFAASDSAERAAMTPRQVPVEGLHAKWLSRRRALVAELAGLEDLGLLPPHPARIHFTYLDSAYLASGGRRHDSASVGDAVALPYQPRVVLISENKDTAVGFPEVPRGVAIEGAGRGASTHAAFPWLYDVPVVAYWGDMDADGLEILNEFRCAGLVTNSLLMDMSAYEEWERFGTNSDPQGKGIGSRPQRPVEHLTATEAELYAALIAPDWDRFRRVEQERIPLAVAHAALLVLVEDAARDVVGEFASNIPGNVEVGAPAAAGYRSEPRPADE